MSGFYLMRCLHHDGQDAARNACRTAHRAWVRSGGEGMVSVLIGSALLNDEGASIGNFGIIEARSVEEARRFAEGDPFNVEGIVRKIDITLLPCTFQAQRIAEPMSQRL